MEILRPTIRADVSERIADYIEQTFNSLRPTQLDGKVIELGDRIRRDGTI